MADFDKVTPGQPFRPGANEWNSFIDAALANKGNLFNQQINNSILDTNTGVLFIKNDSAEDVSQYHYLVVTGFLFDPADNESGFKAQTVLKCDIFNFNDPKHFAAPIVILQEPIKAGKIGQAMLKGTTQVRVNIVNKDDTCFRREDGSTVLKSSTGGDLGSVAKETGTGEKWAYGDILGRNNVAQFQVIGLDENNIVRCHPFVDDEAWPVEIKVAMPYLMRRTPFDDVGAVPSRNGILYNYSTFDERKARLEEDEEETEDQKIIPSYIGEEDLYKGDLILARRCIFGGTGVKGEGDIPVEWIDVNDDSRFWMNNPDAEDEETS